jgi:hypothetical protein
MDNLSAGFCPTSSLFPTVPKPCSEALQVPQIKAKTPQNKGARAPPASRTASRAFALEGACARANAHKINCLKQFGCKEKQGCRYAEAAKSTAQLCHRIPMQRNFPPPQLPANSQPAWPYSFRFVYLVVPSVEQLSGPHALLEQLNGRLDALKQQNGHPHYLYLSVLVYGSAAEWVFAHLMPFQVPSLGIPDVSDVGPNGNGVLYDAVGTTLAAASDVLKSNRGLNVHAQIEVWEAGEEAGSTLFTAPLLAEALREAQTLPGFEGLRLPEDSPLRNALKNCGTDPAHPGKEN